MKCAAGCWPEEFYEPPVTLSCSALFRLCAEARAGPVVRPLLRRASAVMTNVPGPSEELRIGGAALKQVMFWGARNPATSAWAYRSSPMPVRCSSASSPTRRLRPPDP